MRALEVLLAVLRGGVDELEASDCVCLRARTLPLVQPKLHG